MSKLEEKVREMYNEYLNSHNGEEPKCADVEIKWKDEKDCFVESCVALYSFDIDVEDDDDIIFYFNSIEDLIKSLPNIDDLDNLYDQDESVYQVGNTDFTIIDVLCFK